MSSLAPPRVSTLASPRPHLSPPLVSSWQLKERWLSLPCCGYQSPGSATKPSSEGLDRDPDTNAGSRAYKLLVLGQIS